MIATFDLVDQPHNSSPYVQIGLIIVLYIRSLLSVDSREFLPSNHCSSIVLMFICFFFFARCCFHVSLASKCRPRYFTVCFCGICMLFIVTAGHISFRRINDICADLVSFSFTFTFHFVNHCWRVFK